METLTLEVGLPIPQTLDIVTSHLKKEGFGILTTIDLSGTLKEKLGVDIGDTLILGACNPNFAYEALMIEEDVSLILPCNIVLKSIENKTKISIGNPFDLINQPSLQGVAAKAFKSLQNVIVGIKDELVNTERS